jgi:hypothetical protein
MVQQRWNNYNKLTTTLWGLKSYWVGRLQKNCAHQRWASSGDRGSITVSTSLLPHECYMPCPPYHFWFDHSNNMLLEAQNQKCLIMQFSPASSSPYLVPNILISILFSNYCCQNKMLIIQTFISIRCTQRPVPADTGSFMTNTVNSIMEWLKLHTLWCLKLWYWVHASPLFLSLSLSCGCFTSLYCQRCCRWS